MHLWNMVRLRSIEGEPQPTFAACRLADVESPNSPHFFRYSNYESQVLTVPVAIRYPDLPPIFGPMPSILEDKIKQRLGDE